MPKKNRPPKTPLDRAIADIAAIRARHLQQLPKSQLGIEWLTNRIGRPWFAYAIAALITAWILIDTTLLRRARFDAAPFPLLQLVLSVLSLFMTAFILITENRQGVIAERRAELILQLSLANEERSAKLIALLEELRRDDPALPDRRDEDARRMARAVDLHTAIEKMDRADERTSELLGE